jgi:GT2 family glycosyltransferase
MTMADRIDDETLEPAADSHVVTVRGVSLTTALFSRALVERIAYFDEEFEQAEDTDYLLRVFETGPNYALLDTVAIYCRRHAGNMTRERGARVRNHLRALHKSMRRRRADPSLRPVPDMFEFKSPPEWQMT